jgi:uncharacterized integral membrane protein
LVLLTLLLIFILQNQARVRVHFLGWSPSMPLGVAMLLAAVIGGVTVAVSGVARIVQLRRTNRRELRHRPQTHGGLNA